ncbi:hypothetical protein RQP46_005640 [Phenoliferia psychrophenolica]
MSLQPAKRLRRSARLPPLATELELPAPACPIVDLPLELMEDIISRLSYKDLYALASTSKLFRKTYRLRAVLMKLERYSLCDNSSWNGELFCLSDAEPGEFGWSPFFLDLSAEPLEIEGNNQYLNVEAVSPEFERFDDAAPTSAYLFIQQTKWEVWLNEKDYLDGQYEKDIANTEYLDWASDLAGCLILATPSF